jgi:siroheme synthase (precorrin-2 oxidase/ferrochelatase)
LSALKLAPEVLPPAFYPVSLNLTGRKCVVIGAADDREAVEKARDLREVGALVTALHDPATVTEADVADAFFVISTPQDAALSECLRGYADKHRFLLCAIDQPAYGFVAMQATVKSGAARIGISTGGISPRVGGILRAALQSALDGTFARFLSCLAHQRRLNRAAHAGDAAARRATMMSAAEGFEVQVQVTYPRWFVDECARMGPQVSGREDAR